MTSKTNDEHPIDSVCDLIMIQLDRGHVQFRCGDSFYFGFFGPPPKTGYKGSKFVFFQTNGECVSLAHQADDWDDAEDFVSNLVVLSQERGSTFEVLYDK